MPKVSIIVPVYNVEAYLPECVESLRNQTLEDIEIILVDDESPDNCPEMCDRYAKEDCRIKVIHKKNEGLGFARNAGLSVATGEYVAFTDSDDYEEINTYEELYRLAESLDGDVVYYKFIGDAKNDASTKCLTSEQEIRNLLLNMVANAPERIKDRDIQVSSCTGLYRRNLLEDNRIRFHSERELISEDLIFNIDILSCAKKVVVTELQFYFYRVILQSLTHTIRNDRHEMNKKFYHYLKKRMHELGYGDEGEKRCIRLFLGYSRSTILGICASNIKIKEKRIRVSDICTDEIFCRIHDEYPYKKLPIKYRVFFESMLVNNFCAIWLMSKISKQINN